MTDFTITVEIPVAQSVVWSVMVDVERWPEWTGSISRVKRISPGALRVGSRVRIHQPKFPPAFWRVTELKPGVEFAWVSRAPGLRVTARHKAEAAGRGSRVTLSIHYEGWLGTWLAQWTRHLNERYLEMEANGLKARCREFETRTLL
jgi:Polyketide cyclase / dehydrase and lipid transport